MKKNSNQLLILLVGFLFLGTSGSGLLAQDIRTERVSFQRGASSATIEGSITGYETVDYLLNVRAGQYMNVSMATPHGATYFNIMEPGEEYAAIYNGSTSGNQFEGTTAKSGDYRIRVYMMRSAARRGERANYRLEMIVSGSGQGGGSASQLPESGIRTQRISIPSGSNSTNFQGSIRGQEVVDYLLQARAGDYLNISMASQQGTPYFNIMEPGEQYVAIHNGSIRGNQFEGTAQRNGEYRIRIYQMGNAADTGARASFRLEVIKSSNSGSSQGSTGDNFQATGQILCSLGDGVSRQCEFGVVRRGSGDADVTVFRTNGSRRIIYFQNGQAVGYDQSQADRGKFSVSKVGDLYIVRIGTERYEIPEAVIYGG